MEQTPWRPVVTSTGRPRFYVTAAGKEDWPADHLYNVAGSVCESRDKFAIDKRLPEVEIDDLLVIHDTGAHGHSMGFNYNGKLRSGPLRDIRLPRAELFLPMKRETGKPISPWCHQRRRCGCHVYPWRGWASVVIDVVMFTYP